MPEPKATPQSPDQRPFRERKSLSSRIEEVQGIRTKFPNKVPVIVERFHKERTLVQLDKSKFLVPQELTMSQFVTIIRNRMSLNSNQAFYLLIDDKGIASMSMTLGNKFLSNSTDGYLKNIPND